MMMMMMLKIIVINTISKYLCGMVYGYAVRLHALQLDSIRFVSSNSDFFHLNNLQETNNINNNFMKMLRFDSNEIGWILVCYLLRILVLFFRSFFLFFLLDNDFEIYVCVCDGHLFLPLRPYLFYPFSNRSTTFNLFAYFISCETLYGNGSAAMHVCVCSIK